MTSFRALVMLIAIAALFLTFLPMLAITGLGDLNASNGYTPSATAAAATGTAAASATTSPGGATTAPASGAQINEKSTAISFEKTQYTVPAGPVTISYANDDAGVPHNFHVFDGTSASGKSEGATDIKPGANTQTLKLNLTAGKYYFQCDVHPTQMKGEITVTGS